MAPGCAQPWFRTTDHSGYVALRIGLQQQQKFQRRSPLKMLTTDGYGRTMDDGQMMDNRMVQTAIL